MINKFFVVIASLVLLSYSVYSNAQESPKWTDSIDMELYLEVYYGFDFAQPDNHLRPDFTYSFHRHNEVNLNLGLVQFGYENNQVRSSLGIMTGTYANRNMELEPSLIRNIYQANIGLKLHDKHNLWLDAGILESHIGFEGAKGGNYDFLTRSMLADNSPYYSAGAQVSYTSKSKHWYFAGLFLNGWQQIYRTDGNQTPALGHQVQYTPNPYLTINSSSFIGNVYPENAKRMRYFHNLYFEYKGETSAFTFGVDLGAQEQPLMNEMATWYAFIGQFKYSITNKWDMGLRIEYYQDSERVIINQGVDPVFETLGFSLGVNYSPHELVKLRMEAKSFLSERNVFYQGNTPTSENFYIGGSMIFHLGELKNQ